jgi:carboxypeptidase C (cathepsin A)
MLWIEQPIGVGFTQGTPNITNEVELADEFRGFYKSFVDTFDTHSWKTYITGESYAGFYVPYIADGFISANDTEYFNLAGISINDPIIGDETIQQQGMYLNLLFTTILLIAPSCHTSVRRVLAKPSLPQRVVHGANPRARQIL